MKTILCLLFVFSGAEAYAARSPQVETVFPEDGSRIVKSWYVGLPKAVTPALQTALSEEGVQPRDMNFNYEWLQDIALFSRTGTLMLMAPITPEIAADIGLTMGVADGSDGETRLTVLTEETAKAAGLKYKQMKWTFLEGGGLISGTFPDGQPYAITSETPVEGAQKFYEYETGKKISLEQAKALVAQDLGVSFNNLFVIRSGKHLDLFITPLRGGTLLISDPAATKPMLRKIIAAAKPEERKRLEAMLRLYEEGYVPCYSVNAPPDIAGKPLGPKQFPYVDADITVIENAVKVLSGRFKIVRVPGVFHELKNYANSKESHYIAENINFFNGFTGTNQNGEQFQITNSGDGLTTLENYWRSVLSAHGIRPEHAHFPGSYSSGAGLDCRGAISGD
ncbi:MAG: hypothetical protein WCS77_08430 [Elusimicrobiaceae bacterium]